MKKNSIQVLVEPADIHAYVRKLWKTDLFRQSHDAGGFIAKVVDEYAALPRFFFESSDKELETSHFSTWWSGIQLRQYDNDTIHDLYYLHEMKHAGDMKFAAGLEFENFKNKMQNNELEASVCSEIRAYFEMPGLRKMSFPYEIYADRFLADPKTQQRWAANPERLMDELKLYRRNVLTSQSPQDKVEYWIRKFASQNEAWAHIWSHHYDLVEQAMVRLRDRCEAGDRAGAIRDHLKWLLSDEIAKGGDIPFPGEAKAMAGIYWLNKAVYADEFNKPMARKTTPPSPNAP